MALSRDDAALLANAIASSTANGGNFRCRPETFIRIAAVFDEKYRADVDAGRLSPEDAIARIGEQLLSERVSAGELEEAMAYRAAAQEYMKAHGGQMPNPRHVELEQLARDPKSDYWIGPNSRALQAELAELIDEGLKAAVPARPAAKNVAGKQRKSEIEKLMQDPHSSYYRGAERDALQGEYATLIDQELAALPPPADAT